MKRTILIAVVVLLAGLVPARAEQVWDNKDVQGPFDLKRFAQDKRSGDALRFKLVTHERWTVSDVKRGGFAIRIDSDGDRESDRFVLIEWEKQPDGTGGRLRANVTMPDGEVIDRQPARHPTDFHLVVWIDRRDLGIDKGQFRTNAYSVLYADFCPDEGCRDPIPDEGFMKVAFGGLCTDREPDITGTTGDDRIETRGRKVVVVGLAGDDVIRVDRGSVIVCGDAGADVLVGGGRTDVLYGGTGVDEIRTGATGSRPNRAYGGRGYDLLYGGPERDRLLGQAHADYLEGRRGDDYLHGGGGGDDLDGGAGNDTCLGGRSLDRC